jgi:hypothetical protein
MVEYFPLAPRYRLDDEQYWLVGIDPMRRYWLLVNSEAALTVTIPGLSVEAFSEFRDAILAFRNLNIGESITLPTAIACKLVITCVSKNCYAIASDVNGYPVSHLFDHESLESLLMTAHPDWKCAPHHKELGRQLLSVAWNKTTATQVA